jgi:hypothetical protein
MRQPRSTLVRRAPSALFRRAPSALFRRARGALFHVRSVLVVVFMTIALAAWMLFGVLTAGISALFERKRARRPKEPPPSEGAKIWTLPEWMQA